METLETTGGQLEPSGDHCAKTIDRAHSIGSSLEKSEIESLIYILLKLLEKVLPETTPVYELVKYVSKKFSSLFKSI